MKTIFTILASASVALLPVLLDSAVKGLFLLSLTIIAMLLLRRSSASTRHLVWISALAALLVLPLLALTLPKWRVLPDWTKPHEPVVTVSAEPLVMIDALPAPTTQLPLIENELVAPATVSKEWAFRDVIVVAWGGGLLFLIGRLLLGMGRLYLRGRRGEVPGEKLSNSVQNLARAFGIRRKVRVVLGAENSMPMTWGIARPHIQLPLEVEQWDEARLRSVLLHELAHVKRFDTLTQLLVRLACAMHWFNPLVWIAAYRIEFERERSCDDLVLAHGVRASDYAENLLQVVTNTEDEFTPQTGLAMARLSTLENRLKAILNDRVNRRRLNRSAFAVFALLGAMIVLPMAMLDAAEEESAEIVESAPADEVKESLLEGKQPQLLRRVSYDVTGLPPTAEQLRALQKDSDTYPEKARKKAADTLLERISENPESKTTAWLNAVRFADAVRDDALAKANLAAPIKERLEEAQVQLEELRIKFGKKHPKMVEMEQKVQRLQRVVDDELAIGGFIGAELKEARARLKNLSKFYTEKHPQVVEAMKKLQVLEVKIERARLEREADESGVPLTLLAAVRHPEKWAGIGVAVVMNPDGYPQIQKIVEGTPAAKSGKLAVGDLIQKIRERDSEDWIDLQHLKLETVIKAMRGGVGSLVTFQIKRGEDNPFELKLGRQFLPQPVSEKESYRRYPLNLYQDWVTEALAKEKSPEAAKRIDLYEEAFKLAGIIEQLRAIDAKSASDEKVAITVTVKSVPVEKLVSKIQSLRLKNVILVAVKGNTLLGNTLIFRSPAAASTPLMKVIQYLDRPAPAKPKAGDQFLLKQLGGDLLPER